MISNMSNALVISFIFGTNVLFAGSGFNTFSCRDNDQHHFPPLYDEVKGDSLKHLFFKSWEMLTAGSGIWYTDNSAYKNREEPYDQYRIHWQFDKGENSLTGRMYGLARDAEPVLCWDFMTLWDEVEQKAIVFQVSPDGSYGFSGTEIVSDSVQESTGVFHYRNGYSVTQKHQSILTPGRHRTTTFQKGTDGDWIAGRTYNWFPVKPENGATSKVDTLASGTLMLKQEITIQAPVEKLWEAYTTADSWKEWVTPVVEMDFRINGTIKSHYDPEADIGDPGTIVIHVLNYIPHKQITMQAEVSENFPEFMRGEEKNMYSIVEFLPLNAHSTKVTLYGLGYKNEQRWLDLMKFFIQGNEMTLNNLKNHVEK